MNLQTLRSIERAKMGLLKALEKASKFWPGDLELRALRDAAGKDWVPWHNRLKDVVAAAAEKKDKGAVLFTIFLPESGGLKSVTRTPNRCVRAVERRAWYHEELEELKAHTDVRPAEDPIGGWRWDFEYHMREGRRRADVDYVAAARAANMPAWAKEAA